MRGIRLRWRDGAIAGLGWVGRIRKYRGFVEFGVNSREVWEPVAPGVSDAEGDAVRPGWARSMKTLCS